MTARVAPKRKSAREGLLDFFACMCLAANDDERKAVRVFKRLLRARERELAERVGDVAAATLDEMAAELLMPDDADVERVWRVRLRAAILGPPAAGQRKRRTK